MIRNDHPGIYTSLTDVTLSSRPVPSIPRNGWHERPLPPARRTMGWRLVRRRLLRRPELEDPKMDDIETILVEYVVAGRAFAGPWLRLKAAEVPENIPHTISAYLQRLFDREEFPGNGEQYQSEISEALKERFDNLRATLEIVDPISGERFRLEKRLGEINEVHRAYHHFVGAETRLLDSAAAKAMLGHPAR